MKTDLDRHIERRLKNREFRMYFDRAEAKRKIAQEVASLRKANRMTQEDLARAVHTSQQAISRLESPKDTRMPSLEFLDRIARALDRRLVISLAR